MPPGSTWTYHEGWSGVVFWCGHHRYEQGAILHSVECHPSMIAVLSSLQAQFASDISIAFSLWSPLSTLSHLQLNAGLLKMQMDSILCIGYKIQWTAEQTSACADFAGSATLQNYIIVCLFPRSYVPTSHHAQPSCGHLMWLAGLYCGRHHHLHEFPLLWYDQWLYDDEKDIVF